MAHPDYVRVVRVRPLGAEQTELSAEFLFLPEVLADQHSIQEMLCSSRTSS